MLTEICREHPRYYNVYSDRAEVGLGLSCEEAARLTLASGTDSFLHPEVVAQGVEGEEDSPAVEALLPTRNELFAMLSREESSAEDCYSDILEVLGGGIFPTPETVASLLQELESLEDGFFDGVMRGCERAGKDASDFSTFHNLFHKKWGRKIIAAGIHRHFLDAALFGSGVGGCVLAIILSLSTALYLYGSADSLTEVGAVRGVVLASKNIEYSEDNTEKTIDFGDSLLA